LLLLLPAFEKIADKDKNEKSEKILNFIISSVAMIGDFCVMVVTSCQSLWEGWRTCRQWQKQFSVSTAQIIMKSYHSSGSNCETFVRINVSILREWAVKNH
jgi:hypothetical protein